MKNRLIYMAALLLLAGCADEDIPGGIARRPNPQKRQGGIFPLCLNRFDSLF